MVKISVIVPIYNVEKTIMKCLDSILAQTFKDFEIICINDKTPDSSINIVNKYIEKNSNIKLINHNENQGLGAARNTGIKHSNGEYLSFIDSDDAISENFLEILYNKAKTTNSDITMCRLDSVMENNILKKELKEISYKTFAEKLDYLNNGSVCNKLIRADFIKDNKIEFPKGVHYEDNLFIIKAMWFSKRFTTTNKTSYLYYVNPESITRNPENEKKHKLSTIILLDEIFRFSREQNFNKSEIKILKEFVLRSFVNRLYLKEKDFREKLPNELRKDKIFISSTTSVQYQNFFERIFSIKSTTDRRHKAMTILNAVFKFKRKI